MVLNFWKQNNKKQLFTIFSFIFATASRKWITGNQKKKLRKHKHPKSKLNQNQTFSPGPLQGRLSQDVTSDQCQKLLLGVHQNERKKEKGEERESRLESAKDRLKQQKLHQHFKQFGRINIFLLSAKDRAFRLNKQTLEDFQM